MIDGTFVEQTAAEPAIERLNPEPRRAGTQKPRTLNPLSMNWLARSLLRFRFGVWLAVAVGAAVLWRASARVQFDQSIEGFFPADHPALLSYQRAKQAFGGDDLVFVAYDDEQLWTGEGMGRVHEFVQKIRQNVSGIVRVDSLDQMPLPWKVDAAVETLLGMPAYRRPLALPGLIAALGTVQSALQSASDRPESVNELRARICRNPLFRNLLVDSDGHTTVLVVRLRPPEAIDQKKNIVELRQVADSFAREHSLARVAVVGPPVLLADGFISLERDNQRLGAVAMGLMALAMLIAVRSPWWALLPLASGGMTWLVIEAFLNAFDLRLTLSAGPIIAQTVVLCMPAASHLAMQYREATRLNLEPAEAARQTLIAVAVPIAWCSLTAAAGYLALLSSTVRPVFQFGLTMAACNLIAGMLAYGLAPGAMRPPVFPGRSRGMGTQPQPASQAPPEDSARLGHLTAWALDRPGQILAVLVLPSLLIALGIGFLQFESNYIKIYRSRSRVAQDYHFVEGRMGGIGLVELVLPAPRDAKDLSPEWLARLRETAHAIHTAHADIVSQALSLADVLLADGKLDSSNPPPAQPETDRPTERPKRSGILGGLLGRSSAGPATPEQVIQTKLTVLGTPIFSHFLENFWDRASGQTRIIIRIRESADAETKQRAFDSMLAVAQARFDAGASLTGLSHLMTQVTRAIITTQFQATAWSSAVILSMLVLALRSLRLAVLALLPTMLAVSLVLGTMGWLGIKIDLSTALVASVATGLSVDDTFHCLLKWKRELAKGRPADEALRKSYAESGPGVVLSSVAVSLGFLALVFSEFMPTANFGWLVAVATLGGSVGNLVVLPACLSFLVRRSVR
jgi:hypothetical protein